MAPTNPWQRVRTNSDSLSRFRPFLSPRSGTCQGPSLIVTLYVASGTGAWPGRQRGARQRASFPTATARGPPRGPPAGPLRDRCETARRTSNSPGRRRSATATRRRCRLPKGNVGRSDRRRRPGRPDSRAQRPVLGCPRWPRPDRARSRGRRRAAAPTGSVPGSPRRWCRGRWGTPASPRPRGLSPSRVAPTRRGPGPGGPLRRRSRR
jgi:hypothetical protein